MNAPQRFSLTMHRFIRAPREKVFAAFTTRDGLLSWMGTRAMPAYATEIDARPGGAWHADLRTRDGQAMAVGGVFKTLQPHSSLAYTWKWEGPNNPMPNLETLVEVRLEDKDGGTDMFMTHSGFPAAAAREGHNQGWISTFNRLNDYLDPQGTAGTITLLGDGRSTYTRTARMALSEKNVAYHMHNCWPQTPDILAVHPFGRIPALRDGEIELWETAAIVQYIDECFDTGVPLRPGGLMERTRCTQWISAVNSYFYDTMSRRFVLQYMGAQHAGTPPDRSIIDKALGEMPAQFAALDAAYARHTFVASNTLSAADLFIAPILAYVQATAEGGALMAQYPNVLRAQDAIRQRSSFTSTSAVPQ